MPKLICESVQYYSEGDEAAFFSWLKNIPCIKHSACVGTQLELELEASPTDAQLRELIAVFYRYEISMVQLGQFQTKENEKWFYENQKAYWHKQVFG